MKNKVVVITGASSGIGWALAHKYAQEGAKVVLAARNKEKLAELEAQLKMQNAEVLTVATDVSKEEDCKYLIEQTLHHYQQIDILINNAGVSMRALFKDLHLDVMKKLMDVNFWGTVYCTKYALPYLLQSKGSVVGISSIAGYVGLPGRTGYCASKHAMQGFFDALRIENLKTGLHVLVAAPGFTTSNMRYAALTAQGKPQESSPRKEEKMMSAEEVAEHVYTAIKKRKRTLILTFVEGKFTVFLKKWMPAYLDKMIFNHMSKEDPEFLR